MGRVDEGLEGSARSHSPDDFGAGGLRSEGSGSGDGEDSGDGVGVIDTDPEGEDRTETKRYSPPQQDPGQAR